MGKDVGGDQDFVFCILEFGQKFIMFSIIECCVDGRYFVVVCNYVLCDFVSVFMGLYIVSIVCR